mmetsp:Transcript_9112/g.20548  ORF Transcript_9112/g.20548 Transcript_9112/m.20548 type:complete len:277 (-) Transcript_9112:1531-2361(-)
MAAQFLARKMARKNRSANPKNSCQKTWPSPSASAPITTSITSASVNPRSKSWSMSSSSSRLKAPLPSLSALRNMVRMYSISPGAGACGVSWKAPSPDWSRRLTSWPHHSTSTRTIGSRARSNSLVSGSTACRRATGPGTATVARRRTLCSMSRSRATVPGLATDRRARGSGSSFKESAVCDRSSGEGCGDLTNAAPEAAAAALGSRPFWYALRISSLCFSSVASSAAAAPASRSSRDAWAAAAETGRHSSRIRRKWRRRCGSKRSATTAGSGGGVP